MSLLIEPRAESRYLALEDPRHLHRLHQVVDLTGTNAMDVRFLHDGDGCMFTLLAVIGE
ncbi:MAG: hypothetical protein MJA84_01790 [Firmicutes bacterium]|nr:hypothetical protein [Bacillota bacterium]